MTTWYDGKVLCPNKAQRNKLLSNRNFLELSYIESVNQDTIIMGLQTPVKWCRCWQFYQ